MIHNALDDAYEKLIEVSKSDLKDNKGEMTREEKKAARQEIKRLKKEQKNLGGGFMADRDGEGDLKDGWPTVNPAGQPFELESL